MAVKISEKNLKVPFFAEDFCIFDYANYNPIIFLLFIENSSREMQIPPVKNFSFEPVKN